MYGVQEYLISIRKQNTKVLDKGVFIMGLLDVFKKKSEPVEKPDRRRLHDVQAAVNNLMWFSFQFQQDDIFDNRTEMMKAYKKMRRDPHISSCIQSIKAGVMSRDIIIGNEQENSEEIEFIKAVYDKVDMPNVIDAALDFVLFGHQPMEIYWHEANSIEMDGKIVDGDFFYPVQIVAKPPDMFDYDEAGMLKLADADNALRGSSLSREKFLDLKYNDSYDEPYGRGVLLSVYWLWFFKSGSIEFWFGFLEKFGSPFLVGKTENMNDDDVAELLRILTELRNNSQTVISKDQDEIEILSGSGGSSSQGYKEFHQVMNNEITKGILSQTLTTDISDKGSYAASKTHYKVFDNVVNRICHILEGYLNELNSWIIKYNFIEGITPKTKFIEPLDVTQTIDNIVKLSSIPGFKVKSKLIEKLGFKNDEFEIQEQTNPALAGSYTGGDASFSEPKKSLEEIATGKLRDATVKFTTPLINKIKKLKNPTFEDIQKLLLSEYENMDTKEAEKIIGSLNVVSFFKGLRDG